MGFVEDYTPLPEIMSKLGRSKKRVRVSSVLTKTDLPILLGIDLD